MGLFSRKPTAPARQGNGQGAVVLTFPMGSSEPIDVGSLANNETNVSALAGRRPSDRDDLYRVKKVKLRLVREAAHAYDPNAVAIHADGIGRVGYLPRQWSPSIGPALDAVLRSVGDLAAKSGDAVDIYCFAEVEAEWCDLDDLEPGDDRNAPESVSVTLMFDGTWQVKPSRRKGM